MASSPPSTPCQQRVLLGITGSVAAVKGPELCLALLAKGYHVKVLLTQGGANFWSKAADYDAVSWKALQQVEIVIHSPDDEWRGWNRLGDPVLHIDLRDWADIVVVAPLSAHTLSKIAHGACDDTLSCVLRAWDLGWHAERPAKPMVLAPAMNTAMWQHPLTQQQLTAIQKFSAEPAIQVVAPMVKTLACGELGQGAMASVSDIVQAVVSALERTQKGGV